MLSTYVQRQRAFRSPWGRCRHAIHGACGKHICQQTMAIFLGMKLMGLRANLLLYNMQLNVCVRGQVGMGCSLHCRASWPQLDNTYPSLQGYYIPSFQEPCLFPWRCEDVTAISIPLPARLLSVVASKMLPCMYSRSDLPQQGQTSCVQPLLLPIWSSLYAAVEYL